MKAVMLSIRPKWCNKIASGEKVIEIRKNRPRLETPFKCYIYCTISGSQIFLRDGSKGNGNVIGEFICDGIEEFETEFYSSDNVLNAIYRVVKDEDYPEVRMYTSIATNEQDSDNFWLCSQACMSFSEIKKYIGYVKREISFYGWLISNLVIYDEPKEINKFFTLSRPPQSWCYVEEVNK